MHMFMYMYMCLIHTNVQVMYLEVSQDVSSSQDTCGCREEDGKHSEEALLCAVELPKVGKKVSPKCFSCRRSDEMITNYIHVHIYMIALGLVHKRILLYMYTKHCICIANLNTV